MMATKTSNKSDWQTEFYKNGYPNEVIIIADSPTPQNTPTASTRPRQLKRDYTTTTTTTQPLPPIQLPQLYQQPQLPFSPVQTPATTKKRRKVVDSTQDLSQNNNKVKPLTQILPTINSGGNKSSPIDDKDGHFIFKPNANLTQRFEMLRVLGQGTFGKVVECYDRKKQCLCAIKIIRAIQKYRDASTIEIRALNSIRKYDVTNSRKCIHLREWFDHQNHICMVFDLFGQSVYDFLKVSRFKPFSLWQIQLLGKQILTSVEYVHELKLVHTDLKPENILLVNPAAPQEKLSDTSLRILPTTEIRLIDFGSATFEKEFHSLVVSTRHYRAPEIILATGWSYPCDIWSIGCILVEFYTGTALFQTHDNLEHLAMMEIIAGKVPIKMIAKSRKSGQKYFKYNKLIYPTEETSQQSLDCIKGMKQLHEIIPPDQSPGNAHLYDLLRRIFVYDPKLRINAKDALQHPFFHHTF
ncbi:kinase-like domain-containing protein [Chlamydoabsidia padenii]|nr:kinase-like domain-containing protein [Chlamydoabsidia padenii]